MGEPALVAHSDDSIGLLFPRLKPYCIDLLDLLHNPQKDTSFLPKMADLLRRAPAAALQLSLDYTMLPLLLLLDAAVQCRKEKKVDSNGAPSEIRDSAAEGMLMCLEELLKKCQLTSVNQMVVVLKKLTCGALLSPSEASEEFREGIIKCFRAMLLPLQPCSNRSCLCKERVILPTVESITTTFSCHDTLSSYCEENQECLLAFLQSQNAAAAVGHWLSLLLQAAELEALGGHHGSANLRKEAFITLRILVAKVGTADALAFFLPGVVSRFAKAIHVSKNVLSGAAGSTGAIEHALRGLNEFLTTVLDDKSNFHALDVHMNDIMTLPVKENNSIQSVLDALRSLPFNSHVQSTNIAGHLHSEPVKIYSSKDEYEEKITDNGYGTRTLFVHRSKEWLRDTSSNVDKLISAAFPRLCVHPAEKVRKALVDGIRGLLSNCRCTLQRSKSMLLECLCVLVCDDAEIVSVAAQESLESLFALGEKFITKDENSEILMRLVEGLPRVVLGSEETVALTHAQKLLSLIYYSGPDLLVNHLSHSPVNASRFLECMGLCLSHNSRFSGSMNKLIASKPLSTGYLLSIAELKAGNLFCSPRGSINDAVLPVVPQISILQEKDLSNHSKIVEEFPHMPPWFGHVGSQKLYITLAGILRLTGLSIISGHRSDTSLSVIVDQLLDHFRQLISELRLKQYGKEGWRTWYYRHGSGQLLRRAAVAVCMLNEIVYGLSEQSVNTYSKLFQKHRAELMQVKKLAYDDDRPRGHKFQGSAWNIRVTKDIRDHIVLSVGRTLHEYLSTEVWDIPLDQNALLLEDELDLPLHFFQDCIMLHQEIFRYQLEFLIQFVLVILVLIFFF
ncbi:hypothetical protein Cni_G18424 [Canna indica]|uniref:TTI1 N-terminal TPR domain-containing protein n=1 Tax=Canna indica TaxID=4628 RepID=A0AAQ3KPM3_9LILI|nr:hypothetical protein Cni_G18424 [Canna indica]